MKQIIYSALLLAALAGCSSEEETFEPGRTPIRLSSGITAETRAAYGSTSAISGLQFLKVEASSLPADFTATPIVGSRATDGGITFGLTQYYPQDGNHVYFASYYPSGVVNDGQVRWNIDGATDLLTAEPVDAGTNEAHATIAPLNYRHRLAQLEVVCREDGVTPSEELQEYWGRIKSIRLKETSLTAYYTYVDRSVTFAAGQGELKLLKADYTGSFGLTVLPASDNKKITAAAMVAPTGSNLLTLAVETEKQPLKTLVIGLEGKGQLLAGARHVVTLSFGKPAPGVEEISASSTVADWVDGATGSGGIK